MELVTELVNNQLTLCLPVALVLIGAILVFAFGFKSAEQPPFDKLSSNLNDDRKQAGKKRKTKEKKPTVNGHIVSTAADKSPTKRSTPDAAKQKRSEPVKNKKPEETKAKKIVKGKSNEKPVDFDDGNWETVPTKGDKKKKQDSPVKKDRKVKKVDAVVEKLERDDETDAAAAAAAPIKVDDEEIPAAAEDDQKEIILEPLELEIIEPIEEVVTKSLEGGVAFDELGDMWTDAKLVKKSKKKSRRDN